MSTLARTKFDGYSIDGTRRLNKGGGGGDQAYYANMDKLYGVQAQAAQYMLENSMPYLPTYMKNSSTMVKEAMSGELANKMRTQAANDMSGSIQSGIEAANINAQRYGIGQSQSRLLDESNRNAVLGAAQKAGAMNSATAAAEEVKWNRNAGALGQATGMGTGAMQSVGSAASGYGAAGSAMMNNDAANAAGYGKAGASFASALFKDGGCVKAPKLAAGGDPWAAYKSQNPIQTSKLDNGQGGGGAFLAGAMPIVAGKALKQAGLGDAIKSGVGAVKNAFAGAGSGATGSGITGSLATPALENAASTVGGAAPGAMETVGGLGSGISGGFSNGLASAGEAAATGGMEVAGGLGSGAAGSTAVDAVATGLAADAATAGTVAATNAWNPVGWAAAIYGVGSAFDLWADGGEVTKDRKDYTQGGESKGPGTETSDSIPSWLSNGEVVENAVATKLAGKDVLLGINDAGLSVRRGKMAPDEAKHEIGELMMARGKELAGLEMANGGEAKETPDQLLARISAKYGVSGKERQEERREDQKQPASQPAQADGLYQRAAGALKGRSAQIDKAAGYASGGSVTGLEMACGGKTRRRA